MGSDTIGDAHEWVLEHPELLEQVADVIHERYPALTLHIGRPVTIDGLIDVPDDFFQVLIVFPEGYPDELPLLYETGGRRERLSRDTGKRLIDLHYYGDGRACLCHPYDEALYVDRGAPFGSYMTRLVEPFLHSQSVFEREGRWPFGERGHGDSGKWEFYAERLGGEDYRLVLSCLKRLSQDGKPKAHRHCPCGSGVGIVTCHPELLRGMAETERLVGRKQIDADYRAFVRQIEEVRRKVREEATSPRIPWK